MSFTKYLIIFEYFTDFVTLKTHKEYRYFPNLLIHKDPSKRDRHFTNWMSNIRSEGQERFNDTCELRLVTPREYNVTQCNIRLPKGGIAYLAR